MQSQPIRTLRDRCAIDFRLSLNIATPISTNGALGPKLGNLPRRRKRTSAPPPILQVQPVSPATPPPTSPPSTKPGLLGPNLTNFLRRRRPQISASIAREDSFDPLTHLRHALVETGLDDDLFGPQLLPNRFAERDESRCLQEIIPGCFVAFEDDTAAWEGVCAKDALATPNGGLWSHVVSISQLADTPHCSGSVNGIINSDDNNDSDDGSALSYEPDVQTLRLFLPPAPNANADDSDPVHATLSADQLLAARDFLSFHGHPLTWDPASQPLAYPSSHSSYSTASTPSDEKPTAPVVRLLVTAPRNRRADAISVAMCYIAFAFNTPVNTLLRDLHTRRACLPVWKRALCAEGAKFIETVVAM